MTSPLTGRYPAGIPIAKVVEVTGSAQDLFRTVKLESFVRLANHADGAGDHELRPAGHHGELAMKAAMVIVVAGFVAIAQVTIAPLFPLDAAVADFGLAGIALILLVAGPRAAMAGLPLIALLLGFTTNHSPGLLIIAYLPLLPLRVFLSDAQVPLTRYLHTFLAVGATGLWARGVLASAAFLQGAAFAPGDLISAILLPGLVLDMLFLTVLYIPCRLAGVTGRSLSLRRTGWVS